MDEKAKDILSRRAFLGRAAAAGIGAAALSVHAKSEATSKSVLSWDHTADVVVVGSGAAALSAAVAATKAGASVIVLEKGAAAGGTTSKSDGAYWIPNNHHLVAKGIVDRKADAIRYMVCGATHPLPGGSAAIWCRRTRVRDDRSVLR